MARCPAFAVLQGVHDGPVPVQSNDRCRMGVVQHVMSEDSQMSYRIWPKLQVWVVVYAMLMGMTKMETKRSVMAREPVR